MSDLAGYEDEEGEEEDDTWSVETVVEVLELDCECLGGGGTAAVAAVASLPDCLLLFCLICLLIRIIQVFFQLLLSKYFPAENVC